MARTSEKLGRGPCPAKGCAERVSFHRTAGGLVNYQCQACDHQAYATKGGDSERKWLASIEKTEAPTPAPTPPAPAKAKPAPSPAPVAEKPAAPARRPASSVFELGNL
jgi:hypothetical protein